MRALEPQPRQQSASEPQLTSSGRRALPARHAELAQLRREFAHFRETNAPRTRIPDSLRERVLRALGAGVAMSSLQRELGVTSKQVAGWRRGILVPGVVDETPAKETSRAETGARVFEVVEPALASQPAGAPADMSEALELRLGAWSVVIRSTHGA